MRHANKAHRFVRRSSPLPVYRQVADVLERDVLGRQPLGVKVPLPSESELSTEFGVSRVTIRQALNELHFKGLIYREKGRGSYPRSRHIGGVTGFGSFSAEVEASGVKPSSVLIGFRKVAKLPEAMLRYLETPPKEKNGFHMLARVRCIDGSPVAFEESYLPFDLYPGITEADVSEGSLYAAMRDSWGYEPAWADAAIEPASADADFAAHLKVAVGAPVIIAWRVTSSEHDDILEYVRSVYRSEGLALTIHRHRIG